MKTALRRPLAAATRGWRTSSGWAVNLSRHGAVAADKLVAKPRTRATTHRAASLMMGSALIGLGVALFVHANLGLAPYDVFLSVLRDRLGVSLGQAAWLVSAILFAVASILGQRPRPASLVYVFMNGVAVDVALELVRDPDPLAVRIAFVVLGISSIVTGICLVVHSGLTGGAFELLMRAGEARGYDPISVRSSLEIGVFVAGVVLGGDVGVATIFFAIAVGPVMRSIRQAMEDHRTGRATRLDSTRGSAPPGEVAQEPVRNHVGSN